MMSTATGMDSQAQGGSLKRLKQASPLSGDESESIKNQITSVWKEAATSEAKREDAFATSTTLLSKQVDMLVRSGIEAFHEAHEANTTLKRLEEKMKLKDAEIDRLRSTAEKNLSTISNIYTVSSQSHQETQDLSRRLTSEANLRAELSQIVRKHDESVTEVASFKLQVSLLQTELRKQKAKNAALTQEKTRIEHDLVAHQRAAVLSSSADRRSQDGTDVEFYKRKVVDLTSRLNSSQVTLAEKNRHIERLNNEISRNAMQARLGNYGGEGSRKRNFS